MKKSPVIFLILFLITQWVYGNEKVVISQWLQAGPLEARYPAFHQVPDVQGKTYEAAGLLTFDHMDLDNFFPEENQPLEWLWGQSTSWQATSTDENGFVVIDTEQSGQQPRIVYLASYLRSSRWMDGKLEIKSPYLMEVYLDGKRIATKKTTETEENTIGRMNADVKLPRGTHLLMIKALMPAEGELDWKVTATLELGEAFAATDLQSSLSPANIKNINHVLDGLKISSVDPSPDGKYYLVRYSQMVPATGQSESWSEIKRFSDRQVVHSFRHARLSRISWLPRTNAVSFVTSRNGKSSVFLHDVESGAQQLLMEDVEDFSGLQWAPDASYFIYTIRQEGSGTDDNLRQVIGMQDRQGGWRNRSFLYKYDMASGIKTRLTWGNLTTSLHDISPDGTQLLIGQSYPDYTQRPYSRSNLFILDVNTLEVDTIIKEQLWGVSASFSPDGRKLLALGGPSAFGSVGENLPDDMIPNNYDRQAYLYDLTDGSVRSITLDFDPAVNSAQWHAPDNSIYLHVNDQDYQRLYRYDVKREHFTQLPTGVDFASGMALSPQASRLTFKGNMANSPHQYYVMDLKNQKVSLLEDTETDIYRHVEFGPVNDWNFTASTGVEIKGRYYLPADFDPEKKYPVIVYYYGGTNPVGRTFAGRYPFNTWAGNGYVVYVLQPSGATGFGQKFSAAHVNNWGITVADEIIEGTQKFLEAHPFTNADKVGCAGASYGGFMTMLLMTRTDLFAGAISHAGISSISSYWGEGFWGYSYSAEASAESFPWNNPELYVDQSPLFNADKVTTPLLLLHGDSDTNVPPGESIQMYTALKILDRPVELVLVKGEDHHIIQYEKRIEWHNTIMAWWDKHLKDQPQWWEDLYPEKNY